MPHHVKKKCAKRLVKCGANFIQEDQGSQFTSDAFTRILKNHNIGISMDGVQFNCRG